VARKTTQEEIDEANRLRAEGFTMEDVAERLGRSTPWVYKHTDNTGKRGKTEHLTLKQITVEENKKLKDAKKKLREVTCIPVVYGGYNTV
jgi:hypothetical protein